MKFIYIQMQKLKNINRDAIFEKLANLKVIENTIQCNALINAISTAVSRDKKLINNYSQNEVIVSLIKTDNNKLRYCRMFTVDGIKRYVHEGKIYSYLNVCEYFGIKPIDKLAVELKKCMTDNGLFITIKILRWLFETQKRTTKLPKKTSYEKLIEWINTQSINNINLIKFEKLKSLNGSI